jgi:hypothetical protein
VYSELIVFLWCIIFERNRAINSPVVNFSFPIATCRNIRPDILGEGFFKSCTPRIKFHWDIRQWDLPQIVRLTKANLFLGNRSDRLQVTPPKHLKSSGDIFGLSGAEVFPLIGWRNNHSMSEETISHYQWHEYSDLNIV